MPSISAIIPTRDRPHYLAAALASLVGQSRPPAEIIVVDDGDGSAATAAHLSPLIRVLNNHRRGAVPARILGVQAATGDAILFLDDDDWFTDQHYLARVAAHLAAGGDFCFCDGEMAFDSGAAALAFAKDADAESLTRDNTILISGVCYKRAIHDRLGHFDTSLSFYWDWDWYLRVARSGAHLTRHRAPAVAIRVHDWNMSGDTNEAERRANLDRFAAKHGLGRLVLKNHLNIAAGT